MELNIPIGHTFQQNLIVNNSHTASQYGSGLAEVFATPAMVALMENVAYKSIEEFLPENHSTVGTEINVKHLKATLPGKTVSAISKVTHIDNKKISFEIQVFEGDKLVGSATHVRYVVNNDKFIEKLRE